jgi:hypothetical protein
MSLNSLGPSNGMPSSRMTHSLSTPSGVDGSTSTGHSRGGKKLAVRVQMLDDSMTMFQVQVRKIFYIVILWNKNGIKTWEKVNDFQGFDFFLLPQREKLFSCIQQKLDQDGHYL